MDRFVARYVRIVDHLVKVLPDAETWDSETREYVGNELLELAFTRGDLTRET